MLKTSSFKATLLLLTLFTLAGCDSIPFVDNSSDYKGASRGRPLEVPPDLTSVSSDSAYSVPGSTTYSSYNQDQAGKEGKEEPLLPQSDSVKLERSGSQRWLVVKAAPEKVWPVVRDFWTDLGFAVVVENPQTGVMETEWVDPADLTKDEKGRYLDKFQGWLDKMSTLSNRQKFRTRIDRGEDAEITEIYMSHRSVSDVPVDNTKIYTPIGRVDSGQTIYKENFEQDAKARAIAEDLDAELLRRLMVKLGVAEKQSRTIIANPVQEKRATLNKAADGSVDLAMNDQFDRAWRRVGLSLDRIGFLVEDRNRSQGLFFVRYSDIENDPGAKKKGMLDSLKFWGDDDKKEQPAAGQEPSKDSKGSGEQYRIKLARASEGTTVTVVDKDGNRDHSSTAARILNMLYEQLK
jgi:outer membrane protein assembly factor BamC